MKTDDLSRRGWLQAVGAAGLVAMGSTSPVGLVMGDEADGQAAVEIGSRRELFVDHFLVERLDGCRLRLHSPQPREIVLRFDKPWEGLYSGYETVLKDGDGFRFYAGSHGS
jgi:hypothetical protein